MDEMHPAPLVACANCSTARAGGVDRRTFLSAATLAAVAALLEACSVGRDFFTGPSGGPLTVKVSDFAALATVGGIARVDAGNGAPTALVRTGTSTFRGVTMVCTHQGSTINISGSGFRCPNHGALFNSAGANTGGQQTSALSTFSATFDGVNTVTIARP